MILDFHLFYSLLRHLFNNADKANILLLSHINISKCTFTQFLKNLKDEKRTKECQLLIVNDDRQAQIASDIVAYFGLKPFVTPYRALTLSCGAIKIKKFQNNRSIWY